MTQILATLTTHGTDQDGEDLTWLGMVSDRIARTALELQDLEGAVMPVSTAAACALDAAGATLALAHRRSSPRPPACLRGRRNPLGQRGPCPAQRQYRGARRGLAVVHKTAGGMATSASPGHRSWAAGTAVPGSAHPVGQPVGGGRQTAHVTTDRPGERKALDLAWVTSMGGPLIVVPVSALPYWGGCTEDGMITGDGDQPDHYDRACDVDALAGVIALHSPVEASVLVLGDEPATTCYLPHRLAFMRWLAADSDAELLEVTEAALNDPATPWVECGVGDRRPSCPHGRGRGRPVPERALPGRRRSACAGAGLPARRTLESARVQ
ncbi:Imm21 family immunity protein [Streptacidiphilus monticola]